ncbi:MAG: hypothetical protein NVSMB64_09620 [Candidatus Velthaea sp.]
MLGSESNGGNAIYASGYGGRLFVGNNHIGQDVFQVNDSGQTIAYDTLYGGLGGGTSTGVAAYGTSEGVFAQTLSPSAFTSMYAFGSGSYLYYGYNPNVGTAFDVDTSGNAYFRGTISALGYSYHATPTHSGTTVKTYDTQARTANIEDTGESTLVNGSTVVRLNPEFAASIARGNYAVFVTAQGPVQGALYVTQKTPTSFVVRESNGRSTVAFDYRIVAAAYSVGGTAPDARTAPPPPARPVLGHTLPPNVSKQQILP